ncbi:MAG: MobF family relaxase [Acidimicrobiales bacterium]|jgi:conjugative relaxase-like TrwC/TraI family protein
MRMMGAESVEYHRATVLERADDFPGMALQYYASRGETPLVWGGSGAMSLGLSESVSPESYEAVFGAGGARHPATLDRLVATRRPGMELVISGHKSVAELGVIGRAEDMHAIMDAERDATLAYLDRVTRQMGGRRGRAATASQTGGLIYAHTRHATSRAGDPSPHDHVLVGNLVEMRDDRGGWKAADTTLWREHLHAATMVGRVASARVAVGLGYGIEADPGPSGKLGHWRIAGIPDEVLALHSKRAAEIEAECQRRGATSYRARGIAARTTRSSKEHEAERELVDRWRAELEAAGWPVERLLASVEAARDEVRSLTPKDGRRLLSEVLGHDGELARRKVFSRRHVVVVLAPHLYGRGPALLDAFVDRALADPECVPLVGVSGAREQVYSLASVLARETAIAESLQRQLARDDAPAVTEVEAEAAIDEAEASLGAELSEEQRSAAVAICTSGRGAELVEGVAGAGKTTMLKVVAAAFTEAGYQVLGTATSGQAARTLSSEAEIGESRTLASLIWRLDHHQLSLSERTAVILDEVGMTDDVDLVRLAAHVEAAGAKLILVGDHHQIGPVGPGGALGALVSRHPDAVHHLSENRRQHDPEERQALAALRDGEVAEAISFYVERERIHAEADRGTALQAAVDAWSADVAAGHDVGLYAWRRANVSELNERARSWMDATARLSGPELVCPGGNAYRAGDEVVTLAPGPGGRLVTSERAVVHAVHPATGAIDLRTSDGREVRLTGEQAGAERLGYGYATTVHRSQGATVTRAHLFADGEGRELAYVAMSRGRESSHAWTVADGLAQAAEDLRRDWSTQRTPTWAIDTGLLDHEKLTAEAVAGMGDEQKFQIAAIVHAETTIVAQANARIRPPDLAPALGEAQAALGQAQQARADLDTGSGSYAYSEAGSAVVDLAEATVGMASARWRAEHASRWRERRVANREAGSWAERAKDAEQRSQTHVVPEAARLDAEIARHRGDVERLAARLERQEARSRLSRERTWDLCRTADGLAAGLDAHRDRLDGIRRRSAPQPVPAGNRQLRRPDPTPHHEPPRPQLGPGL